MPKGRFPALEGNKFRLVILLCLGPSGRVKLPPKSQRPADAAAKEVRRSVRFVRLCTAGSN